MLAFVIQYFPKRFEFIATQLDAVRASGLSLGVAGTLGLLWGALGVFGAITPPSTTHGGSSMRRRARSGCTS